MEQPGEQTTDETWPKLFRRFLALRREEDLAAAVRCAPPEVGEFLTVCGRGNEEGANARIEGLRERFPEDGEQRFTLALAYCDVYARWCETFKDFPLEHQAEALEAGLTVCREAVGLSEALEDLPCAALYSALTASGFNACAQPERANEAYRAAESMYKRLSEEQPEVYLPYVATALNNIGALLNDLQELDGAQAAYGEALTILRGLIGERPDVYLPDLATTLNNLGNLLNDLQELEAARATYAEALAVRRQLAGERPDVYLRDVAVTLNDLSALLSDLREMKAARAGFEEALTIRRRLATERPDLYLPDLAATLNNVAALLSDLRELEAARAAYEEALTILDRLATGRPEVYLPGVALMLKNVANLLRDLGELEGARAACERSLAICRRLANQRPAIYMPDLAGTLNSLGNLLSDLLEMEAARADYDEALAIYRALAQERSEVYLPDVAATLSNLGHPLRGLGELAAAQTACKEALAIRRRLAEKRPDVYLPHVAGSLNNLGNLLHDLGEPETARSAFLESRELYSNAESLIDAAVPSASLARLERDLGERTLAIMWAEKALESLETGLAQLSTAEHYDKFKARIERAVEVLIEQYADEGPQATNKLLRLFEWLRQVEATTELHHPADAVVPALPQDFKHPVLWIQRVRQSLIFGLLRPGETLRVYHEKNVVDHRAWADRVLNLLFWLEQGSESRAVADAAEPVFSLFPEEIRDLLTGEDGGPVFVSPCNQTLALPLELLPARSGDPERPFAGLRRLIVRFHSLGELDGVLRRLPRLDGAPAVVVGDPETASSPLPAAREGAEYVAKLLAVEACLGKDATSEFMMATLSNPALTNFIFSGHGRPEALALAGGSFLTLDDLRGRQWKGAPYVHLDCCYAGRVRGAGGGRFLGMPSAMIRCGASVVLASYHPLYDEPAKAFSCRLYDLMVNTKMPLGEALLQTRQWIHTEFHGIPLFWATSVVWGNPDVRLAEEREGRHGGRTSS